MPVARGTNLCEANVLRLTPLPLLCVNEQKRIIAQLDELLVLCDQLAAEIISVREARERLLDAVLAQVA